MGSSAGFGGIWTSNHSLDAQCSSPCLEPLQTLDEALRGLLEPELAVEGVRVVAPFTGGHLQAIAAHRPGLAFDTLEESPAGTRPACRLAYHDRGQASEGRALDQVQDLQ